MAIMLRSTLTVLLVLSSMAGAVAQAQGPERASIEGFVLKAASGEPLNRAQVVLKRISGGETKEVPPSMTAADGKFSFLNLEAGQYELSAKRNGYAAQIYGQRIAGGAAGVVTVSAGQAIRNL